MPLAIINRGLSGRGMNVTAAALPCHGGVTAPAVEAPVGALATGNSGLPVCSKCVDSSPPLDGDFLGGACDISIDVRTERRFCMPSALAWTKVARSPKETCVVGARMRGNEF